jgi:hypothetical protein
MVWVTIVAVQLVTVCHAWFRPSGGSSLVGIVVSDKTTARWGGLSPGRHPIFGWSQPQLRAVPFGSAMCRRYGHDLASGCCFSTELCACCTGAASRRSCSSLWMRLPSSLEGSGAIRMIMVATATFWLAWGKTGVSPLPHWIWSYTRRARARVPSVPRCYRLGHPPKWSPLAYSAS